MHSEYKRCLTPKPHKKTKFLNELVVPEKNSQTKKIVFDSFIYADRITNRKIIIGQAKESFDFNPRKRQKTQQKNKENKNQTAHTSQNKHKEMDEINQCLSLMKSTKVFQKNILKSRLFKNGEEGTKSVPEPNDEMRDLIFKKKKLREVFNKEIQNIIVKEFRNYFDGKKINKKIIHLTKHIPKKLNKSNIERVIEDFILPKAQQQRKRMKNFDLEQITLPKQKETISFLLDHLYLKMKQTEFLIKPEREKELYEKIFLHEDTRHEEFEYDFSDLQDKKFKEIGQNKLVNKIKQEKLKKKSKLDMKQKQIIFSIENGDIINFISILIICPSLLHTKDEKNNNLLHIAAKLDEIQIFQLLLKKLGKQALSQKNKFGKTPLELAQLFCSKKVIKFAKIIQPCKN